jgi:quercetin dioxygenase-like cupin family protein
VSETTIRRVTEHPMKTSFDATPRDAGLRSEDGWVDMDVRWLLTRETVGAEHSVFGITVFPPGSKHDIHRHPNAEEFEYLVSGHGIARVGDADVELGPGEVVFVPRGRLRAGERLPRIREHRRRARFHDLGVRRRGEP